MRKLNVTPEEMKAVCGRMVACRAASKGYCRNDGSRIRVNQVTRCEIAQARIEYEEGSMTGKYSLIYADPPWLYDNTCSNGAAEAHYDTMKLIDIKRLPVWELAAENAVLAMWFTGTHIREAIALAEAWGFTVRTMKGFTWVKFNELAERHINKALQAGEVEDFYDFLDLLNVQTRINGGNYTRANTEDLLTRDEFMRLIDSCHHQQQKNMWSLAVYTGVRHGELVSLAWEDIDLKAGTMMIRRNHTLTKEFTLPKTEAGTNRIINLIQPAIDVLRNRGGNDKAR